MATSLPSTMLLAMSASKCSFSEPFEYSFRSRKKVPRMPGQMTSMLKTSTSVAPEASSCWARASCSVDDVGAVTSLTLLPVFFSHSCDPALQVSMSLPTEPQMMATSTPPAGAAGVVDVPGASEVVLAASPPLSGDFSPPAGFSPAFLQPPASNIDSANSDVSAFMAKPFRSLERHSRCGCVTHAGVLPPAFHLQPLPPKADVQRAQRSLLTRCATSRRRTCGGPSPSRRTTPDG